MSSGSTHLQKLEVRKLVTAANTLERLRDAQAGDTDAVGDIDNARMLLEFSEQSGGDVAVEGGERRRLKGSLGAQECGDSSRKTLQGEESLGETHRDCTRGMLVSYERSTRNIGVGKVKRAAEA